MILFLILLGVIGISFFQSHQKQTQRAAIPASSSTSESQTGTFVDNLYGRFVYYKDGKFYEVRLPSRISVQLAGIDSKLVDTFPGVRPAWSPDGSKFAFVVSNSSVGIVTYATGVRVSLLEPDPKLDLSKQIDISFSPDGLFLLVKQQEQEEGRSHIRFYTVATGKLATEESGCDYHGVWIQRSSLYATICQIEGQKNIVLIDPANIDKPISSVGQPDTYILLNAFDSSSLLVKKGELPGKLSLTGHFTPLDQKQFTGIVSLDAFIDLPKALARKIETDMKTEKIDDIVVSPNNTFAVFHTPKGLWIIGLPLKDNPYFLFSGTLPSIQPL